MSIEGPPKASETISPVIVDTGKSSTAEKQWRVARVSVGILMIIETFVLFCSCVFFALMVLLFGSMSFIMTSGPDE